MQVRLKVHHGLRILYQWSYASLGETMTWERCSVLRVFLTALNSPYRYGFWVYINQNGIGSDEV